MTVNARPSSLDDLEPWNPAYDFVQETTSHQQDHQSDLVTIMRFIEISHNHLKHNFRLSDEDDTDNQISIKDIEISIGETPGPFIPNTAASGVRTSTSELIYTSPDSKSCSRKSRSWHQQLTRRGRFSIKRKMEEVGEILRTTQETKRKQRFGQMEGKVLSFFKPTMSGTNSMNLTTVNKRAHIIFRDMTFLEAGWEDFDDNSRPCLKVF